FPSVPDGRPDPFLRSSPRTALPYATDTLSRDDRGLSRCSCRPSRSPWDPRPPALVSFLEMPEPPVPIRAAVLSIVTLPRAEREVKPCRTVAIGVTSVVVRSPARLDVGGNTVPVVGRLGSAPSARDAHSTE